MSLLPIKEIRKIYKYQRKLERFLSQIIRLKMKAPNSKLRAMIDSIYDETIKIRKELKTSCTLKEQID